ncbi:hypothetical protein M2148_000137 [Lachnospiraceae bacterium PF1-4]
MVCSLKIIKSPPLNGGDFSLTFGGRLGILYTKWYYAIIPNGENENKGGGGDGYFKEC